MINSVPRLRFAPSPTGYLHIGGLRTALYNYLYAKKNNGELILRIEDTDRNRFVEGAIENLISTLKWSGLEFNEGPENGGNYGPYLQSERLNIYKEHADKLISEGKAYYCFCSQERLTQIRDEQQKKGEQPKYDKLCLSLSKEEVNEKINNKLDFVIRLNVNADKIIKIKDEVRGEVEFNSNTIDDQVLIKSDGYPTYHLANVVDDHLMKITHVIRGEEWLSSTPKHILLYDYFGWEIPVFAHLPLLLNSDKSKLSKRQGDVAVEDYKEKGYLKESLINFVALLGWNAGDDKEFYYMNELIEKFSIERVHKSGAVFNIEKLNWLNGEHIRAKTPDELLPLLKAELINSEFNNNYEDELLLNIIISMKERVTFLKDFIEKCIYYYKAPGSYDETVVSKRWKEETPSHLNSFISFLENENCNTKEDFENILHKTAESLNVGNGKLIHPIRLSVTGVGVGAGLYDILFILGKEEVIKRIKTAINKINI